MKSFGAVEVLQTGLFGFIFLMTFLSYRALKLSGPTGDGAVRTARNFLWVTVILVVVAAAFNVLEKWLLREPPADALIECRESVTRLSSLSALPGSTVVGLQEQIRAHVATCDQPLRRATGG